MAPRRQSEEQVIKTATDLIRGYVKAMAKGDPNLAGIRVRDLRARLRRSGYACYLDLAIIELGKEGIIEIVPETMDSLVYLKRGGDGA